MIPAADWPNEHHQLSIGELIVLHEELQEVKDIDEQRSAQPRGAPLDRAHLVRSKVGALNNVSQSNTRGRVQEASTNY